jgi:hypothetical protein
MSLILLAAIMGTSIRELEDTYDRRLCAPTSRCGGSSTPTTLSVWALSGRRRRMIPRSERHHPNHPPF